MNKDELSESDTIVSRKLCYLNVHYALSPLAQAALNLGLDATCFTMAGACVLPCKDRVKPKALLHPGTYRAKFYIVFDHNRGVYVLNVTSINI